MKGLIGKKVGMTQLYDDKGVLTPVTVVQAGPCVVIDVKNVERDGYSAVLFGFGSRKAKNAGKAVAGQAAKAGVNTPSIMKEFRITDDSKFEIGAEIGAGIFEEGEYLDVTGVTIKENSSVSSKSGTIDSIAVGEKRLITSSVSSLHSLPISAGCGVSTTFSCRSSISFGSAERVFNPSASITQGLCDSSTFFSSFAVRSFTPRPHPIRIESAQSISSSAFLSSQTSIASGIKANEALMLSGTRTFVSPTPDLMQAFVHISAAPGILPEPAIIAALP